MKKVTLQSAQEEGIGFLLNSIGVIGGAIIMQMVPGKINPWITPAVAIALGYGARLTGDNTIKEIGTGVGIAGTMDLTKKGLTAIGDKVPFLSKISESIPQLSGVAEDGASIDLSSTTNLRGLLGDGSVDRSALNGRQMSFNQGNFR